jgi:hypothetical protein
LTANHAKPDCPADNSSDDKDHRHGKRETQKQRYFTEAEQIGVTAVVEGDGRRHRRRRKNHQDGRNAGLR